MSKWDDAPQGIIINFSLIFFFVLSFSSLFFYHKVILLISHTYNNKMLGPRNMKIKMLLAFLVYCVPFLLCFFFNNAKLFYKSIKTFHGISLWAKLFWKLILLTSLFILFFFSLSFVGFFSGNEGNLIWCNFYE